jgi:hypothetical protein
MNEQNFTTSFLVDATPKQAFHGITNVRGWWSKNIEGGTAKLNDEFTYRVKDLHRCTMKLVEVVPDEKVVWLCLDNYFSFTDDKTEWIGDRLIFEIARENGMTKVTLTQEGLTPADECYDICNTAWTDYVNNSLRDLIVTGKGKPNESECEV